MQMMLDDLHVIKRPSSTICLPLTTNPQHTGTAGPLIRCPIGDQAVIRIKQRSSSRLKQIEEIQERAVIFLAAVSRWPGPGQITIPTPDYNCWPQLGLFTPCTLHTLHSSIPLFGQMISVWAQFLLQFPWWSSELGSWGSSRAAKQLPVLSGNCLTENRSHSSGPIFFQWPLYIGRGDLHHI